MTAGSTGAIEVGPNGAVLVSYFVQDVGTSTRPPVPGGEIVASLDPGGVNGTFGDPVVVSSINMDGTTLIRAQPRRGVDPDQGIAWDRSGGKYNGRLYIVYTDAAFPGNFVSPEIFVRTSDDNGKTWSALFRSSMWILRSANISFRRLLWIRRRVMSL